MSDTCDVIFYVEYPYYFPHFLPISKALTESGFRICYVLNTKQNIKLLTSIAESEKVDYIIGEEHLRKTPSRIIFFANVYPEAINLNAKSIFLCHGIGTKKCKYESALRVNDIVLVEGDYRYQKYSRELPEFKHKLRKVGYSKLDALFSFTETDRDLWRSRHKIDRSRKTLLYAPTFFPSSIEKMSRNFPADFEDCNIVVKPHYLSLQRRSYARQRAIFSRWSRFSNCQIVGEEALSLTPYLVNADVMISDESSAVFEFAALNKPVIINQFLKLRLSYYLFPGKLPRRMDSTIDRYRAIGDNPENYTAMVRSVRSDLDKPERYEAARLKLARDVCGDVDGQVSSRIADIVREISS